MHKTTLALITTAALGLAASAQADLTWDWSFTYNFGSLGAVIASGTLTTDPLSGGAYVITGISGTYTDAVHQTPYSILGLDSGSAFGFSPDNTLYTPGYNGSSPADNLQLSDNGLGFYFGPAGGPASHNAIIFDDAPDNYYGTKDSRHVTGSGTFTATLVPAPEPSQVISMLSLAGMGGAGLLLNLRRRK